MSDLFVRTGELKDLRSYPKWAQEVIESCEPAKRRVLDHPIWAMMREGTLPDAAMRSFLLGAWPLIEQFPKYMALNLLKARYGRTRGETLARRWLVRNIRVEQNHADYWLDWAEACGISRNESLRTEADPEAAILSHWCWQVSASDTLAAGMLATNYAVEGITGEWATLVTKDDIYAYGFDARIRAKAMRWLKLHAEYDDIHPWEALEIVCTLVGTDPDPALVDHLRSCVQNTYIYKYLGIDQCLRNLQDMPDSTQEYAAA